MSCHAEFLAAARKELSPLDVWSAEFQRHPAVVELLRDVPRLEPSAAAVSETDAARFLVRRLVQERASRSARTGDERRLIEWLSATAEAHGVSPAGLRKIRGVF